jgi:protein O-mannosyl-transferase
LPAELREGDLRAPGQSHNLFWFLAIVIQLVWIFAAYAPVLNANALSFDDRQYVVENRLVQNPSWSSTWQFVSEVKAPSTVPGYYQPLSMISLMLDWAAGGRVENLRPFHMTSLLLHLANVLLITLLLYQLFGNALTAIAVGLLFGLHPLTVEPVAWIGDRKTVLAVFFALWSLVSYVGYVRHLRSWMYAVSIVCFLLALLAKPTATPLPLLLILLDFWPLRRLDRQTVIEKTPYMLLAVVFSIITYVSQRNTAYIRLPMDDATSRVPLILSHNIVFYLRKFIWPSHLSSHYAFPKPFNLQNIHVIAGVIGTAILFTMLVLSLRRTRALMTGWLFFFIAIFPTMGVIGFTRIIASDKYAYLPMLGFFLPLAWWLKQCFERPVGSASPQWHRFVPFVLMALVAAAETVGTRHYLDSWKTSEALRRHMLALDPEDPFLRHSLGLELDRNNRLTEAITEFNHALQSDPRNAEVLIDLGLTTIKLGQTNEGLDHLRAAAKCAPTYPDAHWSLGRALSERGEFVEAAEHLREADRLRPDTPGFLNDLASVLSQLGNVPDAIATYQRALALNPHNVRVRTNLGILLERQGRPGEAIAQYEKALHDAPEDAPARRRLGQALAGQARWEEAAGHLRRALQTDPNYIEARVNLGMILMQQGRLPEAAQELREALRQSPNDVAARNQLGVALARSGQLDAAILEYQQAVVIDPTSVESHNNLGIALARTRQFGEAADQLRKALALKPDQPDVHYNLGRVLEDMGRQEEARKAFQDALRFNPRHEGALRHLATAATTSSPAP